ncbi:hypothetical protein J6590_072724 [Homalodisca vitripennis]|nr:hypothetical protein J6590_072724 [Homalodisca vitripennis]
MPRSQRVFVKRTRWKKKPRPVLVECTPDLPAEEQPRARLNSKNHFHLPEKVMLHVKPVFRARSDPVLLQTCVKVVCGALLKLDRRRIAKAYKCQEELHKKITQALHKSKRKLEDDYEEEEGDNPSYAPLYGIRR